MLLCLRSEKSISAIVICSVVASECWTYRPLSSLTTPFAFGRAWPRATRSAAACFSPSHFFTKLGRFFTSPPLDPVVPGAAAAVPAVAQASRAAQASAIGRCFRIRPLLTSNVPCRRAAPKPCAMAAQSSARSAGTPVRVASLTGSGPSGAPTAHQRLAARTARRAEDGVELDRRGVAARRRLAPERLGHRPDVVRPAAAADADVADADVARPARELRHLEPRALEGL